MIVMCCFRHEHPGAACGREERDVPPDPRPLAPERRLQAQDEAGQEEQAEVSNLNTIRVRYLCGGSGLIDFGWLDPDLEGQNLPTKLGKT
jgi:hypothetical protein